LKATPLTVTGTRGIEYGEVTAGGIEWKDIDPATLESRLSPGLFFAGEVLDLTGRCGGFNLQAAFSTGYLAGLQAARRALELRAAAPRAGSP
ncbi:MAG: NAD(P)/FAD-dependent oxidoreductase, partial [Thermoanaerobaculia bacterium]